MNENYSELLDKSIEIWFAEDIGEGDHTTFSTIPSNIKAKARLLVKDHGIIAGIFAIERVLGKFDASLKLDVLIPDGSKIKPGDIVFEIKGNARSILQTERLVLNLLQRLSGVATQTSVYAEKIAEYHTKVLDTRKTTPGLRFLEKEAVRLGGGVNHRIGLFDMILVKDNHIDYCGGIQKAVQSAKKYVDEKKLNIKIEVEARSLEDVEIILGEGGVHRILLDNFSVEETRKAVELISGQTETESSGGITLETLSAYAACGVDYISVGALTHQIKSLDLSLKAVIE
jgi:nicotinate-nucleotide pyrophosphorylase (carboxylating)